jgi:hypothetical protein
MVPVTPPSTSTPELPDEDDDTAEVVGEPFEDRKRESHPSELEITSAMERVPRASGTCLARRHGVHVGTLGSSAHSAPSAPRPASPVHGPR